MTSLPRWTEPVEHSLLVQFTEATAGYADVVEVQPQELVTGQDTVLEAVPGDPSVTVC